MGQVLVLLAVGRGALSSGFPLKLGETGSPELLRAHGLPSDWEKWGPPAKADGSPGCLLPGEGKNTGFGD